MMCKSDLCEQGRAPCPTPEFCDYVANNASDDFADTEPCAPPGTNGGSLLLWSLAAWGLVLLIGLGVWHAFR